MKSVFILWHTHELPEEDDEKLIGVYESLASAERAKEKAMLLPGFSEAPTGFTIDEYEVGRDHWTEGFVTFTSKDL